jgi:hypothetical protein
MGDEALVRRQVTLFLEDFARSSLEARARALGVPLDALVRQAARYYLAVQGDHRPATRLPRFARERGAAGDPVGLTLELDEADWGGLEVAAVHERVPLARVIEHAAVLFLADMNSGRVAVWIVASDPEDD